MNKELKFAFLTTIPVLMGYVFLGMAFGILLEKAGLNFIWAFFISLFVYAGSMQFVLISLLTSGVGIISIILMTFSINSRHIFYGISFIEQFKKMGKAYIYMIFSLTDETYSLLCSTKINKKLDEKKVFLLIAVLNHFYWIFGSVMGGLVGEFIKFNTTGIDFAMTALFTVIFMEQWIAIKNHTPAIIGIVFACVSLFIFGQNDFILPALIAIIGYLTLFKEKIIKGNNITKDKEGAKENEI